VACRRVTQLGVRSLPQLARRANPDRTRPGVRAACAAQFGRLGRRRFSDYSLLYDFDTGQLTVRNLDFYRQGLYRNTTGRLFGASDFKAPEQLAQGGLIDDRTTAYVMARCALVLLADGTLDRSAFRAGDAQYAVLQEATTTRFPSDPAFHAAWRNASPPTRR
jgi:serine/threonine-protein kinase